MFSFGTKLTIGAIAVTSMAAAFVKYSKRENKSKSSMKSKDMIVMKGLPNVTGNLCFLNALLQALASVPSFLCYLQEKSEAPFSSSLSSCLEDLNTSSGSSVSNKIYAVLNNLRDVMKRRGMEMDEQHDVQELYHVFMDLIETESDHRVKKKSLLSNHRPQHVFSPISIMDEKSEEVEEEEEKVVVSKTSKRNPVIGLMASLLRCQHCGHIAPIKLTPLMMSVWILSRPRLRFPPLVFTRVRRSEMMRVTLWVWSVRSIASPHVTVSRHCSRTSSPFVRVLYFLSPQIVNSPRPQLRCVVV
jgi:ubiquitin C-terminal hydrolase